MFSEKFTIKIEKIYADRNSAVPGIFDGIDEKIKACTSDEQILLRYLYGNMPLSDVLNYPFETFLDYASHGAFLWNQGAFREKISEALFCQYVVYHRINTEDISPCRSFFYEKAHAEMMGAKSMAEAVLALNYWCAQEATYRASDDRTASPMTTYRSAHGRCGEESTFTVSVLRSMGIPARQVYAPRWSHCDDNHAWVEAWCDGEWHFLGACEPEEILDKGWFLHASSRAMLIHSRWYGSLELRGEEVKDENIVSTQGITTEINEIGTYANTKRLRIQVTDTEGKSLKNAEVRIEVLNYSEFFPIAVLKTKEDGSVEIELGLGSCRICARKGDASGCTMVDVREFGDVILVLTEPDCKTKEETWQSFESFAPQDAVIHSGSVTEDQRRRQKEKLAERTALRLKKAGTGNEAETEAFLNGVGKEEFRRLLFGTLTQKDSLDLKAEVLEAHLNHAMQYQGSFPEDIFVKYILSPRIYLETLTDFRSGIETLLTQGQKEEFRNDPGKIWRFISQEVRECPQEEYDALLTLPLPCLKYKIGSRQSQEMLFVAVCRTLGIPARLNPVDGAMEYYAEGHFIQVIAPKETGTLEVCSVESEGLVYFQNWSVVRRYPGERKLLDLSHLNDGNPAGRCMSTSVPSGIYEVVTANRLPNGNILGRVIEVEVTPGSHVSVELKLEEAELSQMLECVPMPPFEVEGFEGTKTNITDILKGKPHLVVWLSEGQEPTEHILNELCERAEEFNRGDADILFLVNSQEAVKQPTLNRTLGVLNGVQVLCDCVEERVSVLGRRFYVDPESIPLILVMDRESNCVYATSGYNVGTADMILKILGAGIL
ncbi:MAG: transglutaminase-like domain-containing protein [Faecalicatena sp.]|uniref:transglutaminase-like domain-containing protein n=1 Tax=Faecalicatena sp. TaxID=2005360 RepID=UPI0025852682|nr:transglutaminase-like domain-containing protein [Faecalicatena sp.]MCI6467601.1 transglutaminase-like domain-containing protein [Faecalicatena sp.]MDY5619777.1 transglutaminase-like domain-containing protein [Lachnospiraceae bacterium]